MGDAGGGEDLVITSEDSGLENQACRVLLDHPIPQMLPVCTLMRLETPAVAKNSSSRSKAVELTMSGDARPSPYFRCATTL